MKKKTILIVFGMIIFGYFAYLSGYSLVHENTKVSRKETLELRNLAMSSRNIESEIEECYFVKIENKMLNIYKMPEYILYDSVNLSSIHLSVEEMQLLKNGINFKHLSELFGFLESSMS